MTSARAHLTTAGRRGRRSFGANSRSALGILALCGLSLLALGCKKPTPPAAEKQSPSAVGAPAPQPPMEKPAPLGERRPVGPRQMVVPGQGITAMRFGATAETIERHMQAPCDVKTESRCLYIKQAIDFTLEKGVMVRAKVHLRDRLVPGVPDQAFGTFYGGMPPEILLGLHRHIVHEELGKPERTEDVGAGAALGLVARDFYPGVTLEYDRIDNGNIVLAAMEVFPAEVPAKAAAEPAPQSAAKPAAPGGSPAGPAGTVPAK